MRLLLLLGISLLLLIGCNSEEKESEIPKCVSIELHGYPTFRFYHDLEIYKFHDGALEVKGYLSFIHKDFSKQLSFGTDHSIFKMKDIKNIRPDESMVLEWSIKERERVLGPKFRSVRKMILEE